MDALTALQLLVFMLPWLAMAMAVLYIGYVAYDTRRLREAAAQPPAALGPDPADELARINTELARASTQARLSLEAAKGAIQKGVR